MDNATKVEIIENMSVETYISAAKMAQKTRVSERTLRSRIRELEQELKSCVAELEKSRIFQIHFVNPFSTVCCPCANCIFNSIFRYFTNSFLR